MAFSKRCLTTALIWLAGILFSANVYAENPQTIKAEPDGKGNITFTLVSEGLQLNQAGLVNEAKKYLEEAYKPTKFVDIKVLDDKGIVYGKCVLNAFYTENSLASSNIYNVDFFLRVDCKDKKARVQIIAKEYTITSFSDIKGNSESTIEIVSTPPFGKGKKSFKKAYAEFERLANTMLSSAVNALKSASAEPEMENW